MEASGRLMTIESGQAKRLQSLLIVFALCLAGGRLPSSRAQEVPAAASPPKGSALPEGLSIGRKPNPGSKPVESPADARTVLTALAVKANGGDAKAASVLVDRILAGSPVALGVGFQKEVEAASGTEAARILGLTLLRTGNTAFEKEGLALIDKAVEGESVLAMEVLAQILLEGEFGREKSVEGAIELLKRARQLPGASEAHRILGDLAKEGRGMPKDPVLAIEYYRRGAEAGAVSSMLALHRLFRSDGEGARDLVEAERLGRNAAESGSLEAILEMAAFYERYSENAPEWLRSADWLRRAADMGSPEAALRLADLHFQARLGPANSEEGVRLLRAAASMGSAVACLRIGEAYREGKHLPEDPVAATAWTRISAEMGLAAAENAYGLALISGSGVISNPTEALAWFRRAAEKGSADAKVNLGELHQHGVGVAKDAAAAEKFYREAAVAGHGIGQEKLAGVLSAPEATGSKSLEAAFWAARAVASGRTGVSALAEKLRESLPPEERTRLDEALASGVAPDG